MFDDEVFFKKLYEGNSPLAKKIRRHGENGFVMEVIDGQLVLTDGHHRLLGLMMNSWSQDEEVTLNMILTPDPNCPNRFFIRLLED